MKKSKMQLFLNLLGKKSKKIAVGMLTVVVMCFLCSCGSVDPNIATEKEEKTSNSVKKENGVPEYVDADALANRSYELCFLLAQKKFASPNDINVNALVQYAFCHLSYENLVDMPGSEMKIRTASFDDIKNEIERQFGEVTTDITKSDLYNGQKNCFEMWEPNYGTEIFYDVEVNAQASDTYKVITTFYTDSSKEETLGRTILTAKDSDQHITIQKLSSGK